MNCICNCILGLLNTALLSLGICILASGAYLSVKDTDDCGKALTDPLLVIGSLLLLLSIIGLMATACSSSIIMCVYLILLSILIVGVFGFTIFVFSVTNKSVGQVYDHGEKLVQTKKPSGLSNWLDNKVNNEENWKKIKSCLINSGVCTAEEHTVEAHFSFMMFVNKTFPTAANGSLTTLKAGCCKPPNVCGFTKKSDTYWEIPKKGALANSNNEDCPKWNNEERKLCFDCHTCKGGVINNLAKEWRLLAQLNMILLLVLTFIYILGCCAFCF